VKRRITVEEAQQKQNGAQAAQWVDVRSESEFAAGHIPGAANIPLNELEARLGDISSDKPVLLICQSGKRAEMAAELLEKCRAEIILLEGGTKAWSAAGLPLVQSVRTRWSLERQVRLIAGLLVVIGVALALRIHRNRAQASEKNAAASGAPRQTHAASKQMFAFSILYLFLLFAMLLVDRLAGPLFGQVGA